MTERLLFPIFSSLTIDEAIKLIKNDNPNSYEGKFIVKIDAVFMEKAKEIIR